MIRLNGGFARPLGPSLRGLTFFGAVAGAPADLLQPAPLKFLSQIILLAQEHCIV